MIKARGQRVIDTGVTINRVTANAALPVVTLIDFTAALRLDPRALAIQRTTLSRAPLIHVMRRTETLGNRLLLALVNVALPAVPANLAPQALALSCPPRDSTACGAGTPIASPLFVALSTAWPAHGLALRRTGLAAPHRLLTGGTEQVGASGHVYSCV